MTDEEFNRLVDRLRNAQVISARDKYLQRLSFAYGQAKMHNPLLTREDVQEILDWTDHVVRSSTS